QALLRKMVREKCDYAIIETTSEGIKQYRHWGIYYDVSVFTNLTPEHIESHGSFEKYKQAKGKLFAALDHQKKPTTQKTSVVNLDDQSSDYFLSFPAQHKIGFSFKDSTHVPSNIRLVKGSNITDDATGVRFQIHDKAVRLKLLGRFSAANALAAISVGLSQNISLETAISALEQMTDVPGRMQIINEGQPFKVIVDYAHEPAALEQVYQSLKSFHPRKIISVLGSQGGGRDKRKRPLLGELAARYTDYIIITNEDPYDDDPIEIINDVASGIKKDANKIEGQHFFKILDREEAIDKAIRLATSGDIVIITGKGSEQNMVIRTGKKVPWNDEAVVRRLIQKV
ncbi:UDP-N-acetylmuramyl-tripeptide synthetase, partial [Patescibacteria group bacterium]|nr:UDP-N-acetylmuramyl-tripeptide synthetase [Patescibacteria group bacterium]